MTSASETPLLVVEEVSKAYGPNVVLRDLSFDVKAGEVHAILGENGAGKSTLIKILCGLITADAGQVVFKGEKVAFGSPHEALHAGIGTVHQEFTNCAQLNVTENLFLGQGLPKNRLGLVSWLKAEAVAREVLDELGVSVDVRSPMSDLSPATCKLVEIARALVLGSDVLVLDEPTATLDIEESARLFQVIAALLRRGVGVIYVSHRLQEVLELSDRISVLRDGRMIATEQASTSNVDDLVRMMVGRSVSSIYPPRQSAVGRTPALEVRGLEARGVFSDVSFTAHRGEIVGIAGLDGSGRSEVAQTIGGAMRASAGSILSQDVQVGPTKTILEAIRAGIVYVPADRQGLGLFLDMSIAMNIAMPGLRKLRIGPFNDRRRQRDLAAKYVSDLSIRCSSISQVCSLLSGGNQQKVLLAKWLSTDPQVLVLDEPTSGVDVGAKAEIHRIIRELSAAGTTVVLASSDLPELLGMCDRIIVMKSGLATCILEAASATAEEIAYAAASSDHVVRAKP